MKPFDYQKYLKNNPLLKEAIAEISGGVKSPLAVTVSKLYDKMIDVAGDIESEIDTGMVDDVMEEIVQRVGHTPKQKKIKGFYKFCFGGPPEFHTLTDPQLKALVPFLQAVIKNKEFRGLDRNWDGKKIGYKDV